MRFDHFTGSYARTFVPDSTQPSLGATEILHQDPVGPCFVAQLLFLDTAECRMETGNRTPSRKIKAESNHIRMGPCRPRSGPVAALRRMR